MALKKGQTNSGSFGVDKNKNIYNYGNKDKEKAKQENIKGGKNRVKQMREKGQFRQLMDEIIERNGSSKEEKESIKDFPSGIRYNYKLLDKEPKQLNKLFKDYLTDKLNEISSNGKTYKENVVVRMLNILLNKDTSNSEFLKALEQAREIVGEKQDNIIINNNIEQKDLDVKKLKELKDILNNNDIEKIK